MKTLLVILMLVVLYGIMSRFVGITIGNIAGLPGGMIGLKSKSKKDPRFILGTIISAAGQSYVFLAYTIYLINWTRVLVNPESLTKYIVWFFCAVATVGVVQGLHMRAKKEVAEVGGQGNVQVNALLITEIVTFVCFFIFLFFPDLTNPLWSWVNRIGFLF